MFGALIGSRVDAIVFSEDSSSSQICSRGDLVSNVPGFIVPGSDSTIACRFFDDSGVTSATVFSTFSG